MQLHPFEEVLDRANVLIRIGATVFQEFNCAKCGIKQIMDAPNRFYELGVCEECGHTTNIKADGCNYMVVAEFGKGVTGPGE